MIRTLARSLRQYRKSSVTAILLSILEVILEIAIPLVMSDLIDRGIQAGNMGEVWRLGIALLVLAILEFGVGAGGAWMGARASVGFAANLRDDMYDNVQTFSFGNIDKFSTGSIVTRLTTDVTNVQNAYMMIIRMGVRGPVMLAFCWIVSFTINRQISFVFLAVIPILAIALGLIMWRVSSIFNRVFATYDTLNNVVQENVAGIRVVKSFNREEHEIGKFGRISQRIYEDFARGERLIALNTPLMQACMYACMILISWLGAKAIVASGNNAALGLTTGQLTALFTYATQILMALMMLSMVFTLIVIAQSSAKRIAELLNEQSDIASPEPGRAVTQVADGSVEFDHVSFAYASKAEKNVLEDVNLTIKSGEVVGIIGGTGSSKSSLVNLIARLYDVTAGTVRVGGIDVRDYDLDALRGQVAMVLQKNELFSGTIAENLRWGDENATDDEVREAAHLACADEFVDGFPEGYDTYIEQGGSNVSGGQKQRLCIARALLRHPKVLILDDSTSAVDTKTDAKIRAGLASYLPQTTKIIIAQRISSVQDADRIVVMEGGRISDVGTHDELMRRSAIYRETYTSQNKMGTDESDVEAEEAAQDEAATAANTGAEKGGEADE